MRITIDNLPPIASGSFELRPLTIFIGPNNTGKSRAGLLAWAFARALNSPFVSSALPRYGSANFGSVSYGYAHLRESDAPEYDGDWRRNLQRDFRDHIARALRNLPIDFIGIFNDYRTWKSDALIAFAGDLIHIKEPKEQPFVRLTGGLNPLHVISNVSDVVLSTDDWSAFLAEVGQVSGARDAADGPLDERFWTHIKEVLTFPSARALYVPAGRAAFADAWSFFASLALQRAGVEESTATLPLRAQSFLQTLLTSASLHAAAKVGDDATFAAVDLIERKILKGRVTATGSPSLPFPLVYSNIHGENEQFTIDLANASSSISEVGPLAMILKSSVQANDLIVIDEPEAHLHPENQRRMAQALVRLATAGITVVAPTHSSTIMYEISNLARASTLSTADRADLGLEEADRLTPDKIGVYFFRPGEAGSTIEEIPFDPDGGYAEESFIEVAEALGDESYVLDTMLQPAGR